MAEDPTIPTIRRAGITPSNPRKFFVNLPVSDLQRSITFFEALGFDFSPHFTDATATCMLVGEDAYAMLLTEKRFAEFTERPLGDRSRETNAILVVSVPSREAVDQMKADALAAGGSPATASQDYGFMYSASFRDPDGHMWSAFWMDPAAVPR